MLKNYIVIALRRLTRERTYVLINIFSLALGIASFMILALYLRSELTYDRHQVNRDRIYRIVPRFHPAANANETSFAVSQIGIGPLLTQDYPQLGKFVRFQRTGAQAGGVSYKYEDKSRYWTDVFLADPTVFEIFTHKILYGDPKTALDSPTSIALSRTMARYYFGDANPIGKNILSPTGAPSKVTLVFEDLPENSHLRYDALISFALMDQINPNLQKNLSNTLWNVGVFTYLMVPPGFDPKQFDTLAQRFFDARMATFGKQIKTTYRMSFQPLTSIHFGEKLDGDLPTGNIFYVYGFAAVAVFILFIACINYMNLATARAAKRAKEIGVRKVMGATESQLVGQFLGESAIFTAIALVLAFGLVELALGLTSIGTLMGKEHLLGAFREPLVIGGVVVLGVVVALLAGLYPSFYLSTISPLAALTHQRRSWRAGLSMRQVLVFAQLVISIAVIACTMLMNDQMRYVHNLPLGFDKENRLLVTLRTFDVVKNLTTIKSELRRLPNVLEVSNIGIPPGTGSLQNLIPLETNEGTFEPTGVDMVPVGMNFASAFNVPVVAGRAFDESIATDGREAILVNESLVKKMGWTQPIGKRVQAGPMTIKVVGVVKDFHYASLHNVVGPLVLRPIPDQTGPVPEALKNYTSMNIVIALTGVNLRQTIGAVEKIIRKFDPRTDFAPDFLDDRLNKQYRSENDLMKLTGIFAMICIFISVMGLFGLTAFTTEERTREIGIRKVLGASEGQIIGMLSKPLLVLIVIAAVPAIFASYKAISTWLERFVYHTSISALTFVVATVLVTIVALLTVALQSRKTAQSEPVEALRYE
jgi:putative ABC transport system permease protein